MSVHFGDRPQTTISFSQPFQGPSKPQKDPNKGRTRNKLRKLAARQKAFDELKNPASGKGVHARHRPGSNKK